MKFYSYISCIAFSVVWILLWIFIRYTPNVAEYFTSTSRFLASIVISYNLFPFFRKAILRQRVSSTNKAVFITGCGSGFGFEVATKLYKEGFIVFAACHHASRGGALTLKELNSHRMHVLSLEITSDESVNAAVEYVKQNLGNAKLWAVVNNAGYLCGMDIAWTTMEEFKHCLEVNTLGSLRVTKAFLPMLITFQGRIIFVNSMCGRIPIARYGAYAMSKYALVALSEILKQEIKPFQVRVISVEPEIFRTPLADFKFNSLKLRKLDKQTPKNIKKFYGETYFEKYLKAVEYYVQHSSPKIHIVTDCLYDAVTLKEPSSIYRPCRNSLTSLFYWIERSSPLFINEFIVEQMNNIIGIPKPVYSKSFNKEQ